MTALMINQHWFTSTTFSHVYTHVKPRAQTQAYAHYFVVVYCALLCTITHGVGVPLRGLSVDNLLVFTP